MKKCFLLMAGIILLVFAACQSDELANGGRNGEVAASFSVQLPGNGNNAVTRAATAGDGTSVNRCIMEIYLNDELYSRQIGAIQPDGLTAGFDVRLVTSQTYKFVFWADHVESVEGDAIKTDLHYNTADLRNISMQGDYNGSGKDNTRDAFFASLEKLVTNAFSESVELTRPFGQLNIKTEDLASIPDNQKEAFVPVTAGLSFKNLYTGFNAATGNLLGEPTAVAYKAASDVVDANGNLTVDYLFAPNTAGGQHLVNMTLAVYNAAGGQITTKALNNIPVQRNYKTNVTGNLLTVDGKVNVMVTPAFSSPALSEKVIEVASVSEVAEALKTNTNVVVMEAPKEAATISLPKYESGDVAVSITLPETSNDITINYTTETGEESKNAPKELNITTPSVSKIIIDASESTVTLNGQSYTAVEATTADNTLIVGKDVTVADLTVKKGNVEIYGTVNNISFTDNGGYVTVCSVSTAAQLKAAGALVTQKKCRKIVLTADIDLNGSSENLWEPMNAEYNALKNGETNLEEFDGGNHTIRNLYVDNVTNKTNTKGNYYGGLFYVLNGTVKDLTIDGATVTCFRGAALIGRLDAGLVENCHVKNARIYSEQKAGGLAGYVNNSSQDLIIRGCSASDITLDKLSSMDEAYMMGGFIGYLQSYERNTLIENNSVSNIAINYIYTSPDEVTDKVADMEQTYCHAFIGNVINTSKKDESYNKYSVVLKNNRVDKQLENAVTCDRTNNYIGWWAGDYNLNGNNVSYSTKLVIDGEIMDRWIEVKRVANLLRTGGDISIYRYVDLTKNNKSSQEINITAETVLTLEKNAVLIVGKQQVNNKSKLTVKGAGAMKATDYLLMNETGAELIIEGGIFTATSATDANGVAVYNQGKCTVNSGVFDAPGFTLMNTGNADMTVTGGTVKCGGIKTGYALMAAGSAAKLTVSGGDIEAIQSIGGAQVNISGGSVYCEGVYYALYNGGGNTSISGGYFYSPTGKNIYVASGTVKTTGGYFSDKSAPLESGYKFQDISVTENGNQYNYQVVSE
uniref:DUF6562 domain-containing protein n=1 Tax=Bacteroides stercoris TaxID=46506 RepID=UPI0040260153